MSGPRIVHVALADDWEGCRRFGEYDVATVATSFDDIGYIHASTRTHLPAVLERPYGQVKLPLLLIVLDEQSLAAAGIDTAGAPTGAPSSLRGYSRPSRWRLRSSSRPSNSTTTTADGSRRTWQVLRCARMRLRHCDRAFVDTRPSSTRPRSAGVAVRSTAMSIDPRGRGDAIARRAMIALRNVRGEVLWYGSPSVLGDRAK
ncbi:DUF952 domain-containing protein [Rhodococcus sp. 66b]|uniref:DUF952 domain-containing protein n=1 Tax=Rhodococcus sp. 66b TaxID=1945511 RepID=UPI0009B9A13D|nr:DUF952 domain-containing protein [Rhodococcus sp. 66b]OQM77950.1 hypothetical protein B0E55_06108 [Rhodococcus sp. 66b]